MKLGKYNVIACNMTNSTNCLLEVHGHDLKND